MTTTAIRKKLENYLKTADDKKIKAIYTMVEDEINTTANEPDAAFIKELERRSKAFSEGTTNTYTWDETKKAAIKKARSKKK